MKETRKEINVTIQGEELEKVKEAAKRHKINESEMVRIFINVAYCFDMLTGESDHDE